MSAPVRLPPEIGFGIVLAFAVAYFVHWLRRAFRQPRPPLSQLESAKREPQSPLPESDVLMFDGIQRVFHWTMFIVLGIMTLTGIAIYVPGLFDGFLSVFGITETSAKIFW
ncbi:MAG: hypothetical protein QXW58_05715, partial [Thermosphaera sp.]